MQKKSSLSVIMPALNEEKNIAEAIQTVEGIVPKYFADWELLIFNDGSQDRTGEIAEEFAKKDSHIRVTHHKSPKNLGGVYKSGLKMATKEFVIMIPGDNENGSETLGGIFEEAGSADIIVPYVENPEVRPFKRRMISKAFVTLVNIISRCHLKYYNGTVLHKTKVAQTCLITTDGFGYQAELLVKLIKKGFSFKEVGVLLAPKPPQVTNAFRLNNIIKVAKFLGFLAVEMKKEKNASLST